MRKQTAAIYAIGHFLVDFSCSYLLLNRQPEPWLFIVYNFCAFALQMPIGLLADMTGRNRTYALSGIALVLSGLLPLPITARVLLAGIGNACYHVGGGRESLLKDNKLAGLGLFVSPGALGIFLGSFLSTIDWITLPAIALLALLFLLVVRFCNAEKLLRIVRKPDWTTAALMFSVVLLRSFIGMCMQTPWKIGIFAILGAVATAAGKLLGGIAADRLGSRPTGVSSLLLAAVLFLFPNSAIAGIVGCLLFQMTMPVTLKNASLATPGYEGFSFGLLTFALFLGYLPAAAGMHISPTVASLLCVVSAAMLLHRRKCHD